MAEKRKKEHREVKALRDEVKNLASQLNTAVGRIKELETEKKQAKVQKPPERELSMREEVQALRQEISNLATALNTAVERIRELEEGGQK